MISQLLTDDEIFNVMTYLDAPSVGKLLQVNKRFYQQSQRTELWRGLFSVHIPRPPKVVSGNHLKERFQRFFSPSSYRFENLGTCQWFEPRLLHRSCFDETTGKWFVFGGDTTMVVHSDDESTGLRNDLWTAEYAAESQRLVLSQVQGLELPSEQRQPSPVCASAAAVACLDGRLYVFGGVTAEQDSANGKRMRMKEGWVCHSDELLARQEHHQRLQRAVRGDDGGGLPIFETVGMKFPGGRWGHTLTPIGRDYLLLFGGSSPGGVTYNDLWLYSRRDNEWFEVQKHAAAASSSADSAATRPCGRSGHAAALVGDHIYFQGGNDVYKTFDELWRLNIRTLIESLHNFMASDEELEDDSSSDGGESEESRGVKRQRKNGNNVENFNAFQSHAAQTAVARENGLPAVRNSLQARRAFSASAEDPLWECCCRHNSKFKGPSACIGATVQVVGKKLFYYGGRSIHQRTYNTDLCVLDLTTIDDELAEVRRLSAEWTDAWKQAYTESLWGLKWTSFHHLSCLSPAECDGPSQLLGRTGACSMITPTGIVILGGLLESGELSSQILHLNLFGTYPCPAPAPAEEDCRSECASEAELLDVLTINSYTESSSADSSTDASDASSDSSASSAPSSPQRNSSTERTPDSHHVASSATPNIISHFLNSLLKWPAPAAMPQPESKNLPEDFIQIKIREVDMTK